MKNGPLFNRRCTDVICVILFWAFFALYVCTCYVSYRDGQPDKLLRPVNGDGQLCGVGDLEDYPNLYYIIRKSDASPKAVCITKCPKELADTFKCHGTSKVTPADCKDPSFYVAYGTFRVLNRFCLPNPEKLPNGFSEDSFDNIIGSFGLDDI